MNKRTIPGGLSLLPLFISPVVVAQTPADTASADNQPIEIVITTGRKEQALDDTLTATSVVSREMIGRQQSQTVGEVLRQLPGISFGNAGGMGKQTSLYLRGTNSDHVLVLIDGVKVDSATVGSTAFELLPLSQVERIEVVRGPRSSLYGAEAIGGVVQIFTRQGRKTGFNPRGSISYGSHNTRKADLNFSGGNGRSWYNLNAATERTDGFDALAFDPFGGPDEEDDDGFDSTSYSIRAGHDFANNIRAEISTMRSTGTAEFDGSFQNETDFLQQVTSAKLSAPVGGHTRITAQIGQSRDEQENLKDGTFSSRFDTKRNSATLQAETDLGAGSLVYGVDYEDDVVDSTTDYSISSRDNTGLFGSYQARLGQNHFEAALRKDDNEQFGGHTTGSVAYGYDMDNDIQLRASYGSAFKAPNFNDLYFPDTGFFVGNPDLEPEKSKAFELGINGKLANGRWAINAFQTDVDNLIAFNNGTMENVSEARMRGVELEWATTVSNWQLSANATLQDTENLTGANKGNRLARRPEKVLNLNIDRRIGRFGLGATLHAEDGRYDDAANANRMGGFATVDLRGQYQIAKDWRAGFKIGNLLDKDYETVKNYNQEGVNALLTLEYAP